MEYIRGVTLETLLAEERPVHARPRRPAGRPAVRGPPGRPRPRGIIHRDLKPANLMVVDPDTPYEKIKVMDFGLAKLVEAEADAGGHRTRSAEFAVGTPGLHLPRAGAAARRWTTAATCTRVGVMLYELLTGRLPFVGPSSMDLMLAHATEMPPRFATLKLPVVIPEPIEAVVFLCLEKNPDDRPQTARELAELYETAVSLDQSGLGRDVRHPAPHRGPGRRPARLRPEHPDVHDGGVDAGVDRGRQAPGVRPRRRRADRRERTGRGPDEARAEREDRPRASPAGGSG